MARFLRHDFSLDPRKVGLWILAFSFAAGLAAGSFSCSSAEFNSVSWMRGAADSPVSIVGLLGVICLPFIFSAAAVFMNQIWLLIPIAFCKALSFIQVSLGISKAYGSAGWLMRFLLMFADIVCLPVLVFFWVRFGFCRKPMSCWTVLSFLGIAACIGCFDFCVISPIVVGL